MRSPPARSLMDLLIVTIHMQNLITTGSVTTDSVQSILRITAIKDFFPFYPCLQHFGINAQWIGRHYDHVCVFPYLQRTHSVLKVKHDRVSHGYSVESLFTGHAISDRQSSRTQKKP